MVIFLAGLSLLLYPIVSDYWNSLHQSKAISNYAEQVSNLNEAEYNKLLDEAHQYNIRLRQKLDRFNFTAAEKKEYNSILKLPTTTVMATIEIPSIIKHPMPIYHGTSEGVLQIGIGHVEGTSFPVGGEGTHAVLSGHRGLPSAKLFTDLDKVKVGDIFIIRVLNETVTYQVDNISVVEPHELYGLAIKEGEDYCTLVTCTPYAINTHRLLVRGRRIANLESGEEPPEIDLPDIPVDEPSWLEQNIKYWPLAAVPLIIIFFIVLLIVTRKRKRSKHEK